MNGSGIINRVNELSIKKQLLFFFVFAFSCIFSVKAQQLPDWSNEVKKYHDLRAYDSVIASKIPVMQLPDDYRGRSLPVSVDNSQYYFFPDILDQYMFFNCQQYSAVTYTYAYERNRLLNKQGSLPENRFPAHYTWNFMNNGDRFTGVSFFYSFQVLKEQGHITSDDYGGDTLTSTVGWISGYDKYYRGMGNRIKAVYSIPTNTEEGVLTLKHWLNDHLNGSATGGVACFSASSNFTNFNFVKLPEGTPEAGKDVITAFYPLATHGMTIVGYNDSIRYDLNNDGKYTNDLDITGDAVVDVRDWEIGAYKMANSYSTWWSDKGFCYILYRAMALKFDYPYSGWDPDRGIWNHAVYIVEPDTGYKSLLTMKVNLTHNSREKIRIKAGISADTSSLFPEHVIEFPFLSFQGGDHVMQGFDAVAEGKTIEMGLDITPLLSYAGSGEGARYFLMVEEKDTLGTGEGSVNFCSFIDYTNGLHEINIPQTDVDIENNTLTILSAAGTVSFDKIQITTENLPAYDPSQSYHMQLAASGGKSPLQWSLISSYEKKKKDTLFPVVYQQRLYKDSPTIPYSRFVLPFSFPFYGKKYDTLYINFYGFVTFENEQLPYPYLTDEEGMMKRSKMISPAFCPNSYYSDTSYGVWIESKPGWVTIRWETGDPVDHNMRNNFALRLYPSGEFEFLYGDFTEIDPAFISYSGYSDGDETNFDVWTNWNSGQISNTGYRFRENPIPSGISLTKEGMLNITAADTGLIYELHVKVTDANKISSDKIFGFSSGLSFTQEIVSDGDRLLKFGYPAHFRLSVRNGGDQALQNIQLKLVPGDTTILMTDSIISISSVTPGAEVNIGEAFTFQLRHPLPDLYPIDFKIEAFTGSHNWKKSFTETVSAPEITIPDPEIFDGYDGFLDPGEVADLLVPVRNLGSLYTEDLDVQITTSDPYLTILSQPVQTIDHLPAYSSTHTDFRLQASQNTPQSYNAELLVSLTNHQTINVVKPFTLKLGKVPVAVFGLSSSQQGSATAMKLSLDTLQVPYEYFTDLPASLNQFSSLFISLGTSGSIHVLSQNEAVQLAHYLSLGGRIYLEGYGTWHYQNKTVLHNYFKYTTEKVTAYPYLSIRGITGTFTDLMDFSYQNFTAYSLYNFIPQPPAFEIFTNTGIDPKILQIAYNGDDYKTIGSIFEFGSLIDSTPPSEKSTLMRRYLDFFDVAPAGPKALFHSSKNSVCRWHPIDFTDDSFDNVISWQWEFTGGTPAVSADRNPSVYYIDAGNYDVKLTVSDGILSRSILKKDFILLMGQLPLKNLMNYIAMKMATVADGMVCLGLLLPPKL